MAVRGHYSNCCGRCLRKRLLSPRLDDDSAPAGFWIPGFVGWHRDNLVAGASKGWRLKSATARACIMCCCSRRVRASTRSRLSTCQGFLIVPSTSCLSSSATEVKGSHTPALCCGEQGTCHLPYLVHSYMSMPLRRKFGIMYVPSVRPCCRVSARFPQVRRLHACALSLSGLPAHGGRSAAQPSVRRPTASITSRPHVDCAECSLRPIRERGALTRDVTRTRRTLQRKIATESLRPGRPAVKRIKHMLYWWTRMESPSSDQHPLRAIHDHDRPKCGWSPRLYRARCGGPGI